MKKRRASITQTAGSRKSPIVRVGRLSRISLLVAVGGLVSMALYSPASAVGDKGVVITDPVDPLQQANVQNGALKVDVDNFPATQPVSGTVDVGNLPAIQTVEDTGHPDEMHLQGRARFGGPGANDPVILHENPFPPGQQVALTSVTAAHVGRTPQSVALRMRSFAGDGGSARNSCSDLVKEDLPPEPGHDVILLILSVPGDDTVQTTFPDEPLVGGFSEAAWCLYVSSEDPPDGESAFVFVIGHRV